ncbi:Histone transcription regulator 3 [Gossypium arboreum]|uniref:Histone transcription regulator 3 n=1 Tax=Gossypium arboreum TaxID=29729 RepID=A0A0B0MRW3_GOSAR|nr:Histone transcription regulator 3 [Gossypium arboreum]
MHFSSSVGTISQAYLLRYTNSLSYSVTDLFLWRKSKNSLFFLSRYLLPTYFFLNSPWKNSQKIFFFGTTATIVNHQL